MRNILITILGFCVAASALAAGEPQKPNANIPPGVGLEEWVPLGESFGFVITSSTASNHFEMVGTNVVLRGYYMIKKSDKWYRTYPPNDPGIRRIPFRRVSPDNSSTNASSTNAMPQAIPFRKD